MTFPSDLNKELNNSMDRLNQHLQKSPSEKTKDIKGRTWQLLIGNPLPINEVSAIVKKVEVHGPLIGNDKTLQDKLITLYEEVDRIYGESDTKSDVLKTIDKTLKNYFAALMLEDIETKLPQGQFELRRESQGNYVNPTQQLRELERLIDSRTVRLTNYISPDIFALMAKKTVNHELFKFRETFGLALNNGKKHQQIVAILNGINNGKVPFVRMIPREMSLLKGLTKLSFEDFTEIDFLPAHLENLRNLETLDLRNTAITKPQEVIYHLPALRKLGVRFLPDLSRLPQLTVLDLTFVHAPLDFSNNKNLEKLRLHHCHLTTIPPTVFSLTHLKILLLDKNELEDIHEIQNLTQLQELDIHDNKSMINLIPLGKSLKQLSCDRDHLKLITFSPEDAVNLQLERILCPNANGDLVIAWQKSPEGPSLTDLLKLHRVPPTKLA